MPYILSVGVHVPRYPVSQEQAKDLIRDIFPRSKYQIERLLPVFDHANIIERQMVVPIDWFKESHTFAERNEIYKQEAVYGSLAAIRDCLQHSSFLLEEVKPDEIDLFSFVSSTGISTPTIDTYCINKLPFRDDVVRMPLWGLGCAGGAAGLARAYEWLYCHPKKAALVVNLEFCSLSFQINDDRTSNFVGSALFGDGVACTLLVGDESPLLKKRKGTHPYIVKSSSKMKKQTLDVMGWDVRDSGFHVIFAKSIPLLVESFWKKHVEEFCWDINFDVKMAPFLVAHPGGAKVLQAISEVLDSNEEVLRFSYDVLKRHGNMSSPTVNYVLREAMLSMPSKGTKSLLTALGPGFCSELLSLEWM